MHHCHHRECRSRENRFAVHSDDRVTTCVWLIRSAITILSWWLGHPRAGQVFGASVPITVAVLAIGLIKARLIIRYFMKVRTAPVWLRVGTDA